ncbi:MAG: signal recognition particle subunit SRP19/SEC65 family protein [Methanobrevibacter sp.]|nr:signal recognition particle subunit SRP19/SEC65 family protein [Methanobrevibacter sp.]
METIIWPVYIDSNRTKKEGRRINKSDAVSSPKLTEISRAANKLKLSPKTEDDKSYPRFWWEESGRVIIEREDISKNSVLIKISETIKDLRQK